MFLAKIILQGWVGCGVKVPGKSLSAEVRSFSRAAIIPLPVAVLVEKIDRNSPAQLEVLAETINRSSFFSAFSRIISIRKWTRERFKRIGPMWSASLYFTSNANYPLTLIPG